MTERSGQDGIVSQVVYYPVKSLQGISIHEWVLTRRGLKHDRMWMLVRQSGLFITQREEHRLALLRVTSHGNGFRIVAPSGEETTLPTEIDSDSTVNVRIWKDDVPAVIGPTQANQFFSDYLGYSCMAVFMPRTGGRLARGLAPEGTPLSFADAYPGLLITSASLVDLNTRTSIPMVMDRFRPNIVVSGTAAYADDTWARVDIGQTSIDCVKPCVRCVLTTVDPDTGKAGKEPLSTLAQYRRVNNGVLFGQNFVTSTAGIIRVGDVIRVVGRKETRPPDFQVKDLA